MSIKNFYSLGAERAGGLLGLSIDYNYLGLMLVPIVSLAIAQFRFWPSFLGRLWVLAALFFTIWAIFLTISRGAVMGLATSFLVLLLRGTPKRLITLSILLPTTLAVALIVPQEFWDRMSSTSAVVELNRASGTQDVRNIRNRIMYIKAGFAMLKDYPLFGVGIGNFRYLYPKYAPVGAVRVYRAVHNTYMQVLAEMGIFGFVQFLGLCLAVFLELARARHRGGDLAHAARHLEVALVGFMVSAFFVSAAYFDMLWILFSLAQVLGKLCRSEKEKAVSPVQ